MSQDSAPRRSQREKKVVKPFVSNSAVISTQRKRKRTEPTSDDDDGATEQEQDVFAALAADASFSAPSSSAPFLSLSDPESPLTSASESSDEDERDDPAEDYAAHTASKAKGAVRKGKGATASTKPAAIATPKPTKGPPAKKAKTTKATGAAPKVPKTTVGKKGRKPKEPQNQEAYDVEQLTRDTKIASDNPLFNALINPAAALQSTVEDFLESLESSPNPAQAELINLILRSCGCNDSVNEDEVVDYDGVVDALDNFTEALKQYDSPTYPLTSKLPLFKKFRKSLSEFLHRLITSAADLGSLYAHSNETDKSGLMPTLQTWVIAMSSSQIRSFRHTATVVALDVETGLCEVAASVEKEAEVVGRQRDAEKRKVNSVKRNAGVGAAAKKEVEASVARLKELEDKAKEVSGRKMKLAEYMKEFVDGVFVHRYRDLDPTIRSECVNSLGIWFSKYPKGFLDRSFLQYVGWVLSDPSSVVRLSASKSLLSVYTQPDYLTSITSFTERFKGRLIEMAGGDTEVNVRTSVIAVLVEMDKSALLEEDEREKMCWAIFDEEVKVRKAVAPFVKGVWEEKATESVAKRNERGVTGRNATTARAEKLNKEDQKKVGVKALAELLVKWSKSLDKIVGVVDDVTSEAGDADADVMDEDGPSTSRHRKTKIRHQEVAALVEADPPQQQQSQFQQQHLYQQQRGRIALAVEALWDNLESVSEWQVVLEVLLLDHSTNAANAGSTAASSPLTVFEDDDAPPAKGKGAKGAANGKRKGGVNAKTVAVGSGDQVDEAWRLDEVEESVLIEVLVAALRRAIKAESVATTRKGEAEKAAGGKGDEDSVSNEITRALIKGLPRLFVKYQSDQSRIADVLMIPTLLNLEAYLEMRMIAAYASLWDDVLKQFLSHSSLTVLTHAIYCIRHFLSSSPISPAFSSINSSKILELEEELSTALRDAVATGQDEIEKAEFGEDEVATLGAVVMRIRVLAGARDMSHWMEEEEGGKQRSAWDIVAGLAERGRLGYKEEETMVEQSLHLLLLHILWKSTALTAAEEPAPEEIKLREILVVQRDMLVEKLLEYAIGTNSNTAEGVKRAAFKHLLDLHVLFAPLATLSEDDDQQPPAPILPTATIPITLDDDIQYQCGEYILGEIERYSEEFERAAERAAAAEHEGGDDDSDTGGESSENDDGNGGGKGTGKRKGKGKQGARELDLTSRTNLEQEYLFIDVISTFLRAIRAGVFHVKHGAVLLAHYGRLGTAFDACVKVVVDVLKEEGMVREKGEVVVGTVVKAVQEAYTLVLDETVPDESNAIQLTKLLSSCFILRGSQLSIIRRLDSTYVVQIQTQLITWITRKLAGYISNKNKKQTKVALSFFKVLIPLINAVPSKDALKIKAHMDQVFAQNKIEPSLTLKIWEPQRAYEKRLGTAVAKEKPHTAAKGRKGGKKAAAADDDDDEDVDGGGLGDEFAPAAPPPKATPIRRSGRSKATGNTPRYADPRSDEENEPAVQEGPTTPKQRSKPKPRGRAAAATSAEKRVNTRQQDRDKTPTPSPSPAPREVSLPPQTRTPSPAASTPPSLAPAGLSSDDEQEEEEVLQDLSQERTPKANRTRPARNAASSSKAKAIPQEQEKRVVGSRKRARNDSDDELELELGPESSQGQQSNKENRGQREQDADAEMTPASPLPSTPARQRLPSPPTPGTDIVTRRKRVRH